MADVLNTLLSIFWFLLLTLPFYFIIRFALYIKNKRISAKREAAILLFFICLVSLFTQTLIPPQFFSGEISANAFHMPINEQIILNPLTLFYLIYNRSFVEHYYAFIILNLFGNILLFIPIGLCLPYIFKIKSKYCILVGFLLSLFIEIAQLFFDRTTDISDLILNTCGAAIGAAVYNKILKLKQQK